MTLASHVMEKMGLTGNPLPGPLGAALPDAVAGAVAGAATLLSIGAVAPRAAAALGPKAGRTAVAALLTASLAAAVLCSALPVLGTWDSVSGPYSYDHPKRILLQHIYRHSREGQVHASVLSFASLDALPADVALPPEMLQLPRAAFNAADWEVSILGCSCDVNRIACAVPVFLFFLSGAPFEAHRSRCCTNIVEPPCPCPTSPCTLSIT